MEKKDHKIVCVLGNGFDIDLGLPTKYTDYMNSPYFQDYLVDNNYGTPENPGVSLFKHFNNIHTEQRWIDIEKELSIMSLDKSKLRASKYNDLLSDSIVEKYEEGFKLLHETLTKYLKNLNYFKIDRSSYAAQFLEI